METPEQNQPYSPREQLYERFARHAQTPILIIGEPSPARYLDTQQLTVWPSIDQTDEGASFGGIVAPSLLEGPHAYETLQDAQRLLKDGGVLAAAVGYGKNSHAPDSHAWTVSGLIDVVTRAGFSIDHLSVAAEGSDRSLVMSVLARKDSA